RAEAGQSDAPGSAAGAWQNLRRKSVCDARFLSAPGDTAVIRAARGESGGVLLSRMAFRCVQRAVRGDSIAFGPGQAEGGAHFCGTFSVRRAGRLRLGFYEWSWSASAG